MSQNDEPYLDLPDDADFSTEKFDVRVQKAQEELLALQRKQEAIAKQKRVYEELSTRQDLLQKGRQEMIEKFTRSLVVVEREAYDAQKRVEQLREIYNSFSQHLKVLESINPKAWDENDLMSHLNKALSAVDDARAEYQKSLPKVNPEAPIEEVGGGGGEFPVESGGEHHFFYWFKSGFAFTLPLLILGTLYWITTLLLK